MSRNSPDLDDQERAPILEEIEYVAVPQDRIEAVVHRAASPQGSVAGSAPGGPAARTGPARLGIQAPLSMATSGFGQSIVGESAPAQVMGGGFQQRPTAGSSSTEWSETEAEELKLLTLQLQQVNLERALRKETWEHRRAKLRLELEIVKVTLENYLDEVAQRRGVNRLVSEDLFRCETLPPPQAAMGERTPTSAADGIAAATLPHMQE